MYIIFMLLLALILCWDLEIQEIPDYLTLTGIVIAMGFGIWKGNLGLVIFGTLVGFLSIWILNSLKLQKVGGGDAKTLAMIGAFMGWGIAISTAVLAYLLFVPRKCVGDRKFVPYSPYIVIALGVIVLWQNVT